MALEKIAGGWRVRFRYGKDQRGRFRMPDLSSDPAENEALAKERARRLKRMAETLAAAGKQAEAATVLKDGAEAATREAFAGVERAARALAATSGTAVPMPRGTTFSDVCEMLLSGEIARRFPDRAGTSYGPTLSAYRAPLVRFCKVIGDVELAKLTVDDAERALAALPADMASSTRSRYAGMLARVLNLAAFPLRLIARSPLPEGWRPPAGPRRVFPFLYPDEDACLLRCMLRLNLVNRGLLYGLLSREGLRIREAFGLTWGNIDLERGSIRLDKNKTRSPRRWRMRDDVTRALAAYRDTLVGALPEHRLFAPGFSAMRSAEIFRADLERCGIKREDLHQDSGERRKIRIHDLRGTFVTLSMACGKSEAWIMDRTGHTTSAMLNKYRSQARHAVEVEMGELGPLDELLGLGQARAREAESTEEFGAYPKYRWESQSPKSAADHPESSLVIGPPSGQEQVGPPQPGRDSDVEVALAYALKGAIDAQRWDVALAITQELGERRRARTAPQVSSLEDARRKRDEGGGGK